MTLRFALNPRLAEDTPEPPVPMAAQWAASFPSRDSPFFGTDQGAAKAALLNLAQGVPGTAPPDAFLARLAAEEQAHGYTHVLGEPVLRRALAEDINRVYRGGDEGVQVEEVAITAGCNLAFALTAQTLAAAGEAICLPTPWFFNHHMTLASLGIRTVPLPTHAPSYVPSVSAFEALLDTEHRLRALVLVTPNNPTGAIYTNDVLCAFARVCRQRNVALILDETYRDFLVDAQGQPSRPHDLFLSSPVGLSDWDWRQTIIHLHSFSKSYAIPGHRLGAIVCDRSLLISSRDAGVPLYGSLTKALDNTQICAARADTQRAVAWAVSDGAMRRWRTTTARELQRRRQAFEAAMHVRAAGGKSPSELGWGVECAGAYYAYVRHPFRTTGAEEVARALASLVGVVVLPGSFFMPVASAPLGKAGTEEGTEEDPAQRLRVSIANVAQERLDEVPGRLVLLSQLWADRI